MTEPKRKRRARGPDRAMRMPIKVSDKRIAANRANAAKQRPGGKLTRDEFEFIADLKRQVRSDGFPALARKTIEVLTGPKTWGSPVFDAAARFAADRCGWPAESVQDLKVQAGLGPSIRFEIVRPVK